MVGVLTSRLGAALQCRVVCLARPGAGHPDHRALRPFFPLRSVSLGAKWERGLGKAPQP